MLLPSKPKRRFVQFGASPAKVHNIAQGGLWFAPQPAPTAVEKDASKATDESQAADSQEQTSEEQTQCS